MKEKKNGNSGKRLLSNNRKRKPDEKIIIISVAVTYLLFILLIFVTSRAESFFSSRQLYDFEIGRVADRDFIADRTVSYIDREATELKITSRENLVLPVYTVREEAVSRTGRSFEHYIEVASALYGDVSRNRFALALANTFPEQLSTELAETTAALENLPDLLQVAREVFFLYIRNGILNYTESFHKDLIYDAVEIVRITNGEKEREEVPLSSIATVENVERYGFDYFSSRGFDENQSAVMAEWINAFAAPTAFFDPERTNLERERVRDEIEPVTREIREGERIIKRGFIISREDMIKLEALGDPAAGIDLKRLSGTVFYLLVVFFLGILLLKPRILPYPRAKARTIVILIFGFLFFLFTIIAVRFPVTGVGIPVTVMVPTALFSMLTAVLLSHTGGIIVSLVFPLTVFVFPEVTFTAFLFSFFSGLTGTYVITNAEKRIELIKATGYLVFVNCAILLILGLLQEAEFSWLIGAAGWGVLNALVSGVLNLALLPLFEHILNYPTVFRLMELSDMNTPFFKRMITWAPGTYGHSVSVANLAESACREIHANHLVARVGAYYHDIGKIDQPEYFIENQQGENRHDDLKPTLSVAVIKSHVKIGIEKAKEMKLPPEVIDVIAQHHGSGLISYFYMEALKKMDGHEKIAPEDFSYSGMPPISKEAAVVMLADTVEAASRTLKKPTVAKLEKFVWSIIMDKIQGGQMSNCELTFRDMDTIKRSFVQILAGHFHSRIEYPKMEDGE